MNLSLFKKPLVAMLVVACSASTPLLAQKKDASKDAKSKDAKSTKTPPTKDSGKSSSGSSAGSGNKINPDNFYPEQLQGFILAKINAYRKGKNLDSLKINDILSRASDDQAQYMALKDEVSTLQSSSKKKTTGKRIAFYGGSEAGDELVINQPVNRGKDFFLMKM